MGLFSKLFTARPAPPVHPVFGRMGFQSDRLGDYWEYEIQSPGQEGVCATVMAGPEGPSGAQAAFFTGVLNDLDALVRRCNPSLADAFSTWAGRPLADDWRQDLKFLGVMVPASAEPDGDWDASFEMRRKPHVMFTVELRNGAPVNVLADG